MSIRTGSLSAGTLLVTIILLSLLSGLTPRQTQVEILAQSQIQVETGLSDAVRPA